MRRSPLNLHGRRSYNAEQNQKTVQVAVVSTTLQIPNDYLCPNKIPIHNDDRFPNKILPFEVCDRHVNDLSLTCNGQTRMFGILMLIRHSLLRLSSWYEPVVTSFLGVVCYRHVLQCPVSKIAPPKKVIKKQ
jgi:hypothetical protein